ncbi:histone acetyltransferase 1 [Coemansia erecta]|uniref:Histone acetyltransferase type B catalytic subunit n=1 Tax=Coemansia erecta TaxID=147472 RepID=A0A9W7XUP5_9FUNG|nr:histone acetyltransferase 1 [Coemansia erecta]
MDSLLAATASQWVTDTNAAVHIQLVGADSADDVLKAISRDPPEGAAEDEGEDGDDEGGADVIQFHPQFTYSIYGEHERVFGYKGLQIFLRYAAGSLAAHLDIRYAKRVDALDSTHAVALRADDVATPLRQHLCSAALCASASEFAQRVARDTAEFRPTGRKMHEYAGAGEGQAYEVYAGDFGDAQVRAYHERAQLLPMLYIEGAQAIDTADERWRVVSVFERLTLDGRPSYALVGFCTLYAFFHWPDHVRWRISQFLVLPPFQAQGHGRRLYQAIHRMVLDDARATDLHVEDPSAAFDDMRDRCDLQYLLAQRAFDALQGAPVAAETLAALAARHKMSRRQTARCVEMALLRTLDRRDERAYAAYRLFVKRRIYAQNADQMAAMDADERRQRVGAAYAAVEEDYGRIMAAL